VGIAGIAPNVRIVPINIFHTWDVTLNRWSETAQNIADAIEFAWDPARGDADVINNSWGYNTNNPNSIQDADAIILQINNALNLGRLRNGNRLGCVVVFASGNEHQNSNVNGVIFPANISGVIAVGAVNNKGAVWDYSSRGDALSVVAPSGGDPGDVVTTDRMGTNGYNSGNYTTTFNGTSAACPQVSGVAALVLSVNPNLTGQEVRDIIECTAQKIRIDLFSYFTKAGRPNGLWNSEVGYGLINAYAAVQEASPHIIGSNTLYVFQQATYSIRGLPLGTTITWSSTNNNINIISGQGTNQVTISICSGSNATLTATLSGAVSQVLTKNITINVGDFYLTEYLDHVDIGLTNAYAQCFDWVISNSLYSDVLGTGTINCSNCTSATFYLSGNEPNAGGQVAIRAKNGNCYSDWKISDIHIWRPMIDGPASYLNPMRGEPLIACLVSPPPDGIPARYSWYIDNYLVEVTDEPCVHSFNWICGYSNLRVVVSTDKGEVSGGSDFWGMCSGGSGKSASYSSAYLNSAGSELIIDKTEEPNNLETKSTAKSATLTVTKVVLFSRNTAKLVFNKDYSSTEKQIRIDVSKLPKGDYYLSIIENEDNIKRQTITINH
jgi:hypothetical protein